MRRFLLTLALLLLLPSVALGASGNTLFVFTPLQDEPPATNPATVVVRNGRFVLAFDTTTAETALFKSVMPLHYSNTTGITCAVTWMADTATTGTIGWTIELEQATTDQDADSFAGVQTITAATVSGTAGIPSVTNVAITKGANMDSIVAADAFYLRLKRDVANDNAAGDAHLIAIDCKET